MRTAIRSKRAAGWPITAILLAAVLLLAACGDSDGGGDTSGSEAEAGGDTDVVTTEDNSGGAPTSTGGDAGPPPSGGTVTFGGEEISMEPLRCFFQEQPRAGLGGVFTHTAQAQGTNAAGEPVVLDMSRAVAEDGTVEFDVSFAIGDPFGADHTEFYGMGQEITFGDNSVSASGEVDDFESGPVTLTFDLPCG